MAAPHTRSGFGWKSIEPNRIPWAALKPGPLPEEPHGKPSLLNRLWQATSARFSFIYWLLPS